MMSTTLQLSVAIMMVLQAGSVRSISNKFYVSVAMAMFPPEEPIIIIWASIGKAIAFR